MWCFTLGFKSYSMYCFTALCCCTSICNTLFICPWPIRRPVHSQYGASHTEQVSFISFFAPIFLCWRIICNWKSNNPSTLLIKKLKYQQNCSATMTYILTKLILLLQTGSIAVAWSTDQVFQLGGSDSSPRVVRNFNIYPGTECVSSVFCPVLSLAVALTFCWLQISESPVLVYLFSVQVQSL